MNRLDESALQEVEAAFERVAKQCIPAPQPGVEYAIGVGALLVSTLLTRIVTHDNRLKLDPGNDEHRERLTEDFHSRLLQVRAIVVGDEETLGVLQRRALWIVDAASARNERAHRGALLVAEICLYVTGRPPPLSRFDAVAALASQVVAVWPTSGGKDNKKKWALVQELFQELRIGAASPNALKTTWKSQRASRDPGSK